MSDANWKAHERATAKRLGGTRAGPQGKRGSDVSHPWLAIECKHRKKLPQFLTGAVAQSVLAAKDGQLAVVVFHELGQRHDNDLVVLRLKDFEDHFGDCRKEPTS